MTRPLRSPISGRPEFFEKLKLFLRGEFEFDHREPSISFCFSATATAAIEPVALENVVDEISISVNAEEPDCDYIEAQNMAYKNDDHQLSNFYYCNWLIKSMEESRILSYPDLKSMTDANTSQLNYPVSEGNHRGDGWNYAKLLHVEDINQYFVLEAVGKNSLYYHYQFRPVRRG